jgi:folate-binding protein YgfZ
MSELSEQYRAVRERGGMVEERQFRTVLAFQGPDRVRFLNGQLTANVAAAKPPCVLPACVTTAKGKLCADVFVTVTPDHILVDADRALSMDEVLEKRFSKYIVADDVTCTDVSPGYSRHLMGVDLLRLDEADRASFVPVNRYGVPGYDYLQQVLEPTPADDERTARIEALFAAIPAEVLEIIRIERGVPKWGFELDENTFPSEAGLDRTHVDFHKGCYIGQEVISRLESVGQANRSLHGFVADAPLAAGMRLFTADDPARDLGRLTSATHSFALDRPIALGYLRRGAPETGLLAASADSPDAPVPVTLHPLPFVS